MESSSLRTLLTTLFVSFLFLQSQAENPYDREEIKTRLENMPCIVQPRFTPVVENYIKGYIFKSTGKAERIMGRAAMYFPIFEKYLTEHNQPQDLKNLAILESALLPKAGSPVGATGLWQFMRETGITYGLKINSNVDERSCPHKSTDAAMRYLARQYERFGNWELALASYNTGAGNILRAVKRGRTNDYWKLTKYLPKETSNFVPAFIAATYVSNYYHLHDVQPDYPSMDMQLTEETKVYMEISFETIARLTGLPIEVVEELNPAFKKDFVPADPDGHYVMLPKRVASALRGYLEMLDPESGFKGEIPELPALVDSSAYRPDEMYYQTTYTIAEGDKLDQLGAIFNCSAYSLKAWNGLNTNKLTKGQELLVWFPNDRLHFPRITAKALLAPEKEEKGKAGSGNQTKTKPSEQAKTPVSGNTEPARKAVPVIKKDQDTGVIFYQLHRNESLLDVTQQFPGVTVQNLLEWNSFTKENPPLPGAKLKIEQAKLKGGLASKQ